MELRKDYLLDRWVVVSKDRGARPKEYEKDNKAKEGVCYFCPGNENLTPPEIYRVGSKDKWKIRVFPNKFPAVEEKGSPETKKKGDFFSCSNSYGRHEVIVETPSHSQQLWDLSAKELRDVFDVYCLRFKELSKVKGSKYVMLFKNSGGEAGTSLVHSHTQMLSYNRVPEVVNDEVNAAKKFKKCPYCRIVEIERKSPRKCFENKTFAAFAPYASRFNYEMWVFPKKHKKHILEFDSKELDDLADIMKKIVDRLKALNVSYNYIMHYAPKGQDLHFHIEVLPRLAVWAGFEFLSGAAINSVAPEDAAKFYRGK